MSAFDRTVCFTKVCFRSIGIAVLNPGWNYLRFGVFNLLLAFPIVNGAIMAAIAMQQGNQRVYSTCIFVIFPNLMVQVKLLICAAKWRQFNEIMDWMRTCLGRRYGIEMVDAAWQEVSERCTRLTISNTKLFYALYTFSLVFTFGMNLAMYSERPPLADYLFFFHDPSDRQFYIWNFVYQLFMFLMIAVGAIAVEGPFIMMTLFFRARFEFIGRLVEMLHDPKAECGVERLHLINIMIEVHSDILRAVRCLSDMFQFVLFTQIVGSIGGEVFALYIIQTDFYYAVVFSSIAIMGQVFVYCFLGDMLVQVADPLPNRIYCINWQDFRVVEQKHLLLAMRIAQKPVFLSIGSVGRLNLPTFIDIFRAAFSYCAMLLSMSK